MPLRASFRQHDPQQRALRRVHRRLFKLRGHHLAETFEAPDLDIGIGAEFGLEQLVLVLVVARIKDLAAVGEAIERRHRREQADLRRSASASAGRRT